MADNRNSRESKVAASVVMWTLLVIVLGTIVGVWVKWYLIGWVFAN